MAGSAEYRALTRHTSDLQLAIGRNLTPLGAGLVGAELITPDQYDDIRTPYRPVNDRAADLVRFIQIKVCQNPQHYNTFIDTLKKDEREYRDILKKLEESLKSGQQPRERGDVWQPETHSIPQSTTTRSAAEEDVCFVIDNVLRLVNQLVRLPAKVRDSLCADAHLVELSNLYIKEDQTWKDLSPYLHLSETEIRKIIRDIPYVEELPNVTGVPTHPGPMIIMERCIRMLRIWKDKLEKDATYR